MELYVKTQRRMAGSGLEEIILRCRGIWLVYYKRFQENLGFLIMMRLKKLCVSDG